MPRTPAPILLVLAALLLAGPAHGSTLNAAESSLLDEVNRTRAAHGVAPLRVDANLQRAARAHSADMLRRGYFAHGRFAQRLHRFGAAGPRLGESLAWGAGPSSQPTELVRMWLRSPPHRQNLLHPGYRRIGVGAVKGSFAGRAGAVVVTADFAGR